MRDTDRAPKTYFRTASRFYQQQDGWYYSTREGEHGPFDSREDAEADARLYAGLHSHLEHQHKKSTGGGSAA